MTWLEAQGLLGPTELSTAMWVLIGVLFALSFFLSGSETALTSLQKLDRHHLATEGGSGRQVVNLLERGRRSLLTTIVMGNETVNVALAAACAGVVLALGHAPWWNLVILTPLLVLVSETTPKVLARRNPRRWSKTAIWPLTALYWLLALVRPVYQLLVSMLARPFGVSVDLERQGLVEQELMVIVDRGAEHGAVDQVERDIIENVFEFDELPVERLMTPRPDVTAIPLETPWESMIERCRQTDFSRIPITGDHGEDIVGVLLVKDLLRHRKHPPAGPRQLRSLLLPPTFVPATKSADDMMREFLERRLHMAFVVDEHGTLVGLITLDDLLDELLGDELEDSEEISEIRNIRPNAITVRAAMDIEDFEEETGIHIPDGDWHTLGGFVFHELGRLPAQGDTVTWEGYRFVVSAMEGRRIETLEVFGSLPEVSK